MSFKSYKLGDIYDFSSGLSKSRDEFGFGHPFVTFKDVFYNYFIPDKLTELANTTEKERQNCSVKRGDVFLTRTSETLHELGQSSVALKDYPNATFNGFSKRLRPNGKIDIYPEYIGYYFRSPRFRAEITSMAVMTTRASLNNEIMSRLKVEIPTIEEQKAIAKILSDLDNKIEVNNKINQRLEDMAQSIFKHWFVDFEFPNEEGNPYKSSGGEMVESELGMIPKGWEVESLYNLAQYINGTSFKAKDYADKGLPIIKIAELKNGITDGTRFFKGEKDEKFYLKNEDILFSWSGNPDTSIDTFIWDKGEAILNQHIFKVVPNENIGYCYMYTILKSLKSTFANIAKNKQTTGLGHVTVKDLKELKVAVNYNQISQYNNLLNPIIKSIIKNNYSNKNLVKARDTLLPKLMSGEIRVPINKEI